MEFKKLQNFRDIAYGDMKKGLLFRSGNLNRLPKKDQRLLFEEYGVRVVIDLRTAQEVQTKPDVSIPGVRYCHIPLITMEEMGAGSEKEAKRRIIKEHKLPDILEYYERLTLPTRKEAYTRIFDVLCKAEGSVLFHCTAGKDRTGILTALILTLCGVDKETIYQDYLRTNDDPVVPFAYKVFALFLDKQFRLEFKEYFKAKPEYLDKAYDSILQKYGDLEAFLKEICGIDREKRDLFLSKYLRK